MRRAEVEGSGEVRFLTFSCYRRLPLLGHPGIRDRFAEQLARVTGEGTGVELLAWVVMPEHVHLVVRVVGVTGEVELGGATTRSVVGEPVERRHHAERRHHDTLCRGTQSDSGTRGNPVTGMLYALKKPVAAEVVRRWRELDAPILGRLTTKGGRTKFWQPGGGYDRTLRSDRDVWEKIAYCHGNPVARGLCLAEREWPWSSVHAWERSPYVGPTVCSD